MSRDHTAGSATSSIEKPVTASTAGLTYSTRMSRSDWYSISGIDSIRPRYFSSDRRSTSRARRGTARSEKVVTPPAVALGLVLVPLLCVWPLEHELILGQGFKNHYESTKFQAEVYVLTKEEGGRHTPFFTGYRPQFYLRTTDVTGNISLPEGVEMVVPGDNTEMEIELITPVALEEGLRFAIREGSRTVGAGAVTRILV